MKRSTKRKRKKSSRASRLESVRWTVEMAASEFGLNPRTVSSRVKRAGVLTGEDGLFSTRDIHEAICGDLEKEKTRKTREEADQVALENAASRKELVDRHDFVKRLEPVYVGMKQIIMGSKLSDAEKDQICADLAKLNSV